MSDARPPHTEARIRSNFEASLPFPLDTFQVRAFDALDAGASVVVAAPTGSGKTLVAEYAIERALRNGGKAFYTAPIKALSNQKFRDLTERYGAANVGLLTGDNSVNGAAPIVVMTTEVLRNMIYAASPALDGLRYVVLDEVHYLQDVYRGPVWEEIIIHTPMDVDLVCLSATVSNAEQLAAWVSSVRGHTEAIIHEERPTELRHLYLVGNRDSGDITMLPTFVNGRPNPQALRLDVDTTSTAPRSNRRRPQSTPRRVEIIDALRHEDMLPAITFIFSRSACDEAVGSCLHSGLRLTRPDERRRIRTIVEEHITELSDEDLRVLDYGRFLEAIERGFAAHHAGMVPPFKEAVEACFVEGLVKAVFATETLALGINMPARTVVIEKLTKFSGERHQFLTPGEYTQLTGRAGRRGIDDVGYAATLWTPFIPFEQVASLAARRTYELKSAFRPTNNMAVNLVRRYQPAEAHHLLSLSFAQFQIDVQSVSGSERIQRLQAELEEARTLARCERGDVLAVVREREARRPPSADAQAVAFAIDGMRPGDVLAPAGFVPVRGHGTQPEKRRATAVATSDQTMMRIEQADGSWTEVPTTYGDDDRRGPAGDDWLVVIATSRRRGRDATLRALRTSGRVIALSAQDFRSLPNVVGHVRLPEPFNPNSRSFLTAAANALVKTRDRLSGAGRAGGRQKRSFGSEARSNDIDAQDSLAKDRGGVEHCPDFATHLAASERAERLNREILRLSRIAGERKRSLSEQFDRVLQLLEHLGYLDGWAVTDSGDMLAGIFHESDLLIAECLREGVLDGLTPAQLAGLVSTFVYEARGPGSGRGRRERAVSRSDRAMGRAARELREGRDRKARTGPARHGDLPPEFPKVLASRYWSMVALADALNDDEEDLGLPLTKALDPGFVAAAARWAGGKDLGDILDLTEGTGGDFVRTIRVLIDLLQQIGKVALHPDTARAARQAADALFRGVVKASSAIEDGVEIDDRAVLDGVAVEDDVAVHEGAAVEDDVVEDSFTVDEGVAVEDDVVENSLTVDDEVAMDTPHDVRSVTPAEGAPQDVSQ